MQQRRRVASAGSLPTATIRVFLPPAIVDVARQLSPHCGDNSAGDLRRPKNARESFRVLALTLVGRTTSRRASIRVALATLSPLSVVDFGHDPGRSSPVE